MLNVVHAKDALRRVESQLRATNEELEKATERLTQQKLYLQGEINTDLGCGEIVGESPALKQALKQVTVASTDATVLLLFKLLFPLKRLL